MKRVAVIGAGNMGLAMAERLLSRGFEVTAVDTDPAACRRASAAGCALAATPLQAAQAADAVLVAVVSGPQVLEVIGGTGAHDTGLLRAGAWPPRLPVLLMSTVAVDEAVDAAARLTHAGLLAIDAPMSGGPARARSGTLSLMLAGAAEAIEAAAPLTGALADRRFFIGTTPGDAMKVKLLNNLLAAVNLAAGVRALAAAKALGVAPAMLLEVVAASSGASWIVNDRMPRALAGDFEPRAAMHILRKDVGLAKALLESAGLPAGFAALAEHDFAAACEAGFGALDDCALYRSI
jgi:L-threonate 2-dehydrogenase